MSARKPRPDAKLKTLPPEQQDKLFALLRSTTYRKALPKVREEFGVETSVGALADFFAWYPLSRQLEQAATFAEQLESQLKANPNLQLDAEKVSAVAQVAFEARAVETQDPALFLALRKQRIAEKSFELERERFREAVKSDLEKGLDALESELRGNPAALALYQELRRVVLKTVETTK